MDFWTLLTNWWNMTLGRGGHRYRVGPPPPPPPIPAPPVLTTVVLSGVSSVILTHNTTAYTVAGLDQYGNPITLPSSPVFMSSNPTAAIIDAGSGIATPVSVGATAITVQLGSLTSTAIILTVQAQVPVSSTVSPNPWSQTAGAAPIAFSVVVRDQIGGVIPSPAGTWSSTDPTNAPINPATGVLTPTNPAASVTVTFTPTGVPGAAGTSVGTITGSGAPFLSSITISGPSSVVATHATTAYTASGFDQYGAPFAFTPVWQSGTPNHATINSSTGMATGVAAGTSSITATGSGITSNAVTLTVAAQVLTSITLSGPSSVVATHNTAAYTAAGVDQSSGAMSGIIFTFHSATPSHATIDSGTGIATGVGVGTSSITATSGAATSNAITLTVSAQVATTSVVSPKPWTAIAGGATVAFTVVVTDQAGGTITSPSGAWSSSDATDAPINSSTGVLTPTNTATGVIITFTPTGVPSAAGTSSGTINASGGGTVTSVALFYNSLPAAPMLLFTGTTYPLIAKDQAGNVLSGSVGAWSTTDGTNAPVGSSTGIVAPASGVTGATITYTHTASGHSATVPVTILKAPPWLKSEFVTYANDAALRNNIGPGVTTGQAVPAPTGGSGALYQDGLNEGNLSVDATRPFMGRPTLLMTFPVSGSPPEIAAPLGNNYARLHLLVVKRYDTGFTDNGGGGGAASYKDGPFAYNAGEEGRTGISYSNTTEIFGGSSRSFSGTIVGGYPDAELGIGAVTTEWTDQAWYCDSWIYEVRGGNIMSLRCWRFRIGTNPLTAKLVANTAIEGPMTVGWSPMLMNYVNPFGMNYNRVILSTLFKSVGLWGCVDGVTSGDPFGIINDISTPTLTGISGGTIAHNTTNNSVVLPGTNFTANCDVVLSNSTLLVQSITINSATQMTVVVNAPSGATIGAGTIAVRNQASQHTTSTQVLTVT